MKSRGPDWQRIIASPAPWREVIGIQDNGDPVYGPEYLPRSCRTGRAVSYECAFRDWDEHHGAIGSAGLWDHARDPGPPPARRDDHEAVLRALAAFPEEFTERWRDVIEHYWRRQQSELVTSVELALSVGRVHQIVIEIRRRVAALAKTPHPQTYGP